MNKGKIIKIAEDTAYIGYEDGSLKEIPIESCDFEPSIGDAIEIYEDIIVKVGNTDENNTQITNTFKKVQLNINKKKLIPFLLAGFLVILASIFILSYEPKQDSKQKNTTSSSITQSNEDDTEKVTADFNKFLEQNIGENIDYKGHITLINDDEIYLDTDKIIINNKKYDSKGFKHSPKIKVVYKGKGDFRGGQSLGLNAKVKQVSGKPQLEIYDVFTVGKTYEQYMQKGIELKSQFELHATVKEVNKIYNNKVLTLLIVVEPYGIDIINDGEDVPFQFKDGKEIKLALTKQTEEEFIKQKRGLKTGDDIRIFGTLMTDSLDVLLANQGGGYLDMKRTN